MSTTVAFSCDLCGEEVAQPSPVEVAAGECRTCLDAHGAARSWAVAISPWFTQGDPEAWEST